MSEAGEDFIYVRERRLPYTTFDADNHLYENRDAMTKFLPREYEGVIKYVEVNGRTKLAIRDKISDYIPNPTFGRVAVPGGYGRDVSKGDGKPKAGDAKFGLAKVRAMPGIDAFFDPEPRLALMKDMGIDRTLLWPTLASVLEGRVADDPDVAVAVVHALNEWMHEHWSFVYSEAIYSTPIISLAAGNDRAIQELEYVHERGAKIFLLRIAPVPTWKGRQSFALPEFDPFWTGCRSWTWWSGCTPAMVTTRSATSMNGRVLARIRCPSSTPAAPPSPGWRWTGAWSRTGWRRSLATAWPPGSRS